MRIIVFILLLTLASCTTRNLYHSYKSDEDYMQDASYCSQQYWSGSDQFGSTNFGIKPLFGVSIGDMPENSWDRCMSKLGWMKKR